MDLTEAEEIKKRWQEYTEELCKKKRSLSPGPSLTERNRVRRPLACFCAQEVEPGRPRVWGRWAGALQHSLVLGSQALSPKVLSLLGHTCRAPPPRPATAQASPHQGAAENFPEAAASRREGAGPSSRANRLPCNPDPGLPSLRAGWVCTMGGGHAVIENMKT